jgi:prophage regulatory protein
MKLLSYDELRAKGIPYSRVHLRRRERELTFPLHVEIGEGRIGWIEAEIDDWLAALAAKRNAAMEAA